MSFVSSVGTQPTSGMFARAHRQQIRDEGGRFGGGWGVAWQGLANIDSNIYDFRDSALETLREGAERLKDDMVQYMKTHAIWKDRTGNARAGLQGVVIWEDEEHFSIFLGHGADIYYGIWLEVRFGGRYAIVSQTVQYFAPQIGATLTGGRG